MGATSKGLNELERHIRARQAVFQAAVADAIRERTELAAKEMVKEMDTVAPNAASWAGDERNVNPKLLARNADKLRKNIVVRVYRSKRRHNYGELEGHISWKGTYTQRQATRTEGRMLRGRDRGGGVGYGKMKKTDKRGRSVTRSITVAKVAMMLRQGFKGREPGARGAYPARTFGDLGAWKESDSKAMIDKHIRARQHELDRNSGAQGLAVLRAVVSEFVEVAVRIGNV